MRSSRTSTSRRAQSRSAQSRSASLRHRRRRRPRPTPTHTHTHARARTHTHAHTLRHSNQVCAQHPGHVCIAHRRLGMAERQWLRRPGGLPRCHSEPAAPRHPPGPASKRRVRSSKITVAGSHSSLDTNRYRVFGRWLLSPKEAAQQFVDLARGQPHVRTLPCAQGTFAQTWEAVPVPTPLNTRNVWRYSVKTCIKRLMRIRTSRYLASRAGSDVSRLRMLAVTQTRVPSTCCARTRQRLSMATLREPAFASGTSTQEIAC